MKALFLIITLLFSLINVAFSAVNLNTANQSQLESVKGIGPVKAKAILDYRKKNGALKSVDDLQNVPGFGDKTIAKVRAKLTVANNTPVKKTSTPPVKKPNSAAATKPAPATPKVR